MVHFLKPLFIFFRINRIKIDDFYFSAMRINIFRIKNMACAYNIVTGKQFPSHDINGNDRVSNNYGSDTIIGGAGVDTLDMRHEIGSSVGSKIIFNTITAADYNN